jgi:quinate dehydrogenase
MQNNMYNALGLPWSYFLHESTDIPSFLALTKTPKFFGAAVTMPNKVAIIPHLDALTDEGRAIGAVNTVWWRPIPNSPTGQRELVGTNTDCIGVREALRQNVLPAMWEGFRGRPGLVIGGGGTSRAAVYALKHFIGCSHVYFINRDASEVAAVIKECTAAGFGEGLIHIVDEAQALSLPKPGVVVSAVPDFAPRTPEELLARRCTEIILDPVVGGGEGSTPGALLEMCYHPSSETQIKALAVQRGWQVVPGVEAMIWQGVEQGKIWTGMEVAEVDGVLARVKHVVAEALKSH